ncbi:hypothetical protein, partial [Actinomadura fibrosa]
ARPLVPRPRPALAAPRPVAPAPKPRPAPKPPARTVARHAVPVAMKAAPTRRKPLDTMLVMVVIAVLVSAGTAIAFAH